MLRDPNNLAHFTLDSFNIAEATPSAFDGGVANARGDLAGTGNPKTLFTVTGEVLVRIIGVCTSDLAGATATVAVGVTGNTAALLAATTATDIDTGDLWNDTTPAVGTDTLANVTGPHVLVNGADIIETVATASVTGGNVKYICLWRPLSATGNVVAA